MSTTERRDIPGYEGRFAVTVEGRVFSLSRYVKSKAGQRDYLIPERELIPDISRHGYRRVGLTVNDKQVKFLVARLVLLTFMPEGYAPKLEANHKNGVTTDDRLSNLEWVTRSENNKHAYRELGRKPSRPWLGRPGEQHPRAREVVGVAPDGTVAVRAKPIKQVTQLGFKLKGVRKAVGRGLPYKGLRWKVVPLEEQNADPS